jgi:hypothetical protein
LASTASQNRAVASPSPSNAPLSLPDLSDNEGVDESEDDSQVPVSQLGAPAPVVDDDGDEDVVDPGEDHEQEKLDHARYSRLAELLDDDGWLPLVRAAYKDESLMGSDYMSNCADRDWLFAGDEVLATVEPSVLKAICMQEGNLPQLYDSNKTVRDVLDRYYKRGDEQATIYIRALTLGNGHMPMTLDQAQALANHALHYAHQIEAHAKDAYKIDMAIKGIGVWDRARSNRGERRYLQDRQEGY